MNCACQVAIKVVFHIFRFSELLIQGVNVFMLELMQRGVSRFGINLCLIQSIFQFSAAFYLKSQQVLSRIMLKGLNSGWPSELWAGGDLLVFQISSTASTVLAVQRCIAPPGISELLFGFVMKTCVCLGFFDAMFSCSSQSQPSPCSNEEPTAFLLEHSEYLSFKMFFFARAVDLQRLNFISSLKIFLIHAFFFFYSLLKIYISFPLISYIKLLPKQLQECSCMQNKAFSTWLYVSLMLGVVRILCQDHATLNKAVLTDLASFLMDLGVKSTHFHLCISVFKIHVVNM